MNRLVHHHTPAIPLDRGRSEQTDVPMASTQWRVEVLVWARSQQGNVVEFTPKQSPIVDVSEIANMLWEIDYLRASLWYRPSDIPSESSKIEEVHEVKSLLDSMNKVFLSLLRWSGWYNYAMYQRAIEVWQILRKDYNSKLNSYLFGRNWFLVDGELWNTNQNVSDKVYREWGRIVSIIASRLWIPVELTQDQEDIAKSITPAYPIRRHFKKTA